MARGDMKVDTLAYTSEVEILNRKENEAVSMTVDYTGVDTDSDGRRVVKAGTPVDKDGSCIYTVDWCCRNCIA